mgnify:CR=1 FL=1
MIFTLFNCHTEYSDLTLVPCRMGVVVVGSICGIHIAAYVPGPSTCAIVCRVVAGPIVPCGVVCSVVAGPVVPCCIVVGRSVPSMISMSVTVFHCHTEYSDLTLLSTFWCGCSCSKVGM